jgi:phosphoribosylformylglycinamidine cyclo-ligase
MPGFYDEGKYDIAGFAVGIVDRKKIVDGSKIREGDALLGIASSGPHSNGFSLIRKVLPDLNEDFGGMPIGRALLEPTRLYVRPVLELMAAAGTGQRPVEIKGMAHITGGGFYENIPRMFAVDGQAPAGSALIEPSAGRPSGGGPVFDAVIRDPLGPGYSGGWTIPPIFARLAAGAAGRSETGAGAQRAGEEILRADPAVKKLLFNTYNMGIGFVLALAPEDSARAAAFLEERGFPAWEIGRVEKPQGPAGKLRFV